MDRAEMLKLMIDDYRKKIALYEAMISEWERELAVGVSARTTTAAQSVGSTGAPDDDLLALVRENEFFRKSQPEAAKIFLDRVQHPLKTERIMEAIVKGG